MWNRFLLSAAVLALLALQGGSVVTSVTSTTVSVSAEAAKDQDPCLNFCTLEIKVCEGVTAADGSPVTVSRDPCLGCQFRECPPPTSQPNPTQKPPACELACTKDLRVCPSGASVARNPCRGCQFDDCPSMGPPLVIIDDPIEPVYPGGDDQDGSEGDDNLEEMPRIEDDDAEDPYFDEILAKACLGNPCVENLQFPVCRPVIMDCVQPPCPQFICISEEPDYAEDDDHHSPGAFPGTSAGSPGSPGVPGVPKPHPPGEVCTTDVKTCEDGTVISRSPGDCLFRCPSRWVLEFAMELAPEHSSAASLDQIRAWLAQEMGVAAEHIELDFVAAAQPGQPASVWVRVPSQYLDQTQVRVFALRAFGAKASSSATASTPGSPPGSPDSQGSPQQPHASEETTRAAAQLGLVGIGELRESQQGLCEDGLYSGSCLRRHTQHEGGEAGAAANRGDHSNLTRIVTIVLGSLSGSLLVLGVIAALRNNRCRKAMAAATRSTTTENEDEDGGQQDEQDEEGADDSSEVAMASLQAPQAIPAPDRAQQMA